MAREYKYTEVPSFRKYGLKTGWKRKFGAGRSRGSKRIRDPYVTKSVSRRILPNTWMTKYRPAYDGVPKSMRMRLRVGDYMTFAPVTFYYHRAILLNSVYQPDPLVAGTQPSFYDEMAAIYRRYMVDSGWIRMCVTNTTTGGVPLKAFFYVNQTSTGPTTNTYESLAGRPDCTMIDIPPDDADRPWGKMVRKFTATQPYSYNRMDDDVFGSTINSNPPNTVYMHIYIIDPTLAADITGSIDYHLFQNVAFYNPKDVEDA